MAVEIAVPGDVFGEQTYPLLLEIPAQVTSGEENPHDINLVIDVLVNRVSAARR